MHNATNPLFFSAHSSSFHTHKKRFDGSGVCGFVTSVWCGVLLSPSNILFDVTNMSTAVQTATQPGVQRTVKHHVQQLMSRAHCRRHSPCIPVVPFGFYSPALHLFLSSCCPVEILMKPSVWTQSPDKGSFIGRWWVCRYSVEMDPLCLEWVTHALSLKNLLSKKW